MTPVGEIDYDSSYDRYYIPVAPGWEIQTKGKGSTFRLAEPDDTRLAIPDSPYLHETVERMARAVNAHIKELEGKIAELSKSRMTPEMARLWLGEQLADHEATLPASLHAAIVKAITGVQS